MEKLSLKALSDGLKAKKFSSVEVTQFFLDRLDRYNASINAFITVDNEKSLKNIGYDRPINLYIKNLALNVADCGLDGIVCSANDLNFLKPILPENFHLVTPGIRLNNTKKHDQQRVSSPEDAKTLGSTMLVIGRSITEDPHPLEVLKKIQLLLK